jgi:hypothetical protein
LLRGRGVVVAVQPDAVQPGVRGRDGVRLEPVADVRDLGGSETEPGAALMEDLGVGFRGAGFAGSDDLRQFGGESDAPELLTLLVGVAVGDDSQAEVAVMFREGVECRPDVGISAPGGFVVIQEPGEPRVSSWGVPVAQAEVGCERGDAQATLLGEGELSGQVGAIAGSSSCLQRRRTCAWST